MIYKCNIQDISKCKSFFITYDQSIFLNRPWFDLIGVLIARDLISNELTTTTRTIAFSNSLEELKIWCDLSNIKLSDKKEILSDKKEIHYETYTAF